MSGASEPQAGGVLYLCTRNAIRSAMAAELTRMRFGPLMRVESAGIRPGELTDGMAIVVMDEVGGDLAKHEPKSVDDLIDPDWADTAPFDLIVSLSPEAHHRALELIPRWAAGAEYWPTFDPSLAEGSREQRLTEYRLVRDGLDKKIAARFPRPSTG